MTRKRHSPVFWFTGLSGSGKTKIVDTVCRDLLKAGKKVMVYDGDAVRSGINRNLTFSPADIKENNRVIAELCKRERERYDYIFVPVISPFSKIRRFAKEIIGDPFYLIYVKASLDEVIRRDAKGLYKKALTGEIKNFIGVSGDTPYQAPRNADLVLDTEAEDAGASANRLMDFIDSIEQSLKPPPRRIGGRRARKPVMTASPNGLFKGGDLQEVLKIIRRAGQSVLEIYNTDFKHEKKNDGSPVTMADKRSFEILKEGFEGRFPEIPILSEEQEDIPFSSRRAWHYFWLIDPLDGTKEFIRRNGEFTINVALVHHTAPVAGVIYAPVKDVFYFAEKQMGSYRLDNASIVEGAQARDVIIKASKRLPLGRLPAASLTVIASRSHMTDKTRDYIERLKSEYGNTDVVNAGSALKFSLISEGTADIYPRLAPTMEWDTAAGHIIIEEAGGCILDIETGSAISYNKESLVNPPFVAFSGGAASGKVRKLLSGRMKRIGVLQK